MEPINEFPIDESKKREQREFETLFKNPKHARAAWQDLAHTSIFCREAVPPIVITGANGEETPQSQIERAVYDQLKKELIDSGANRKPSEGEMIQRCQQYFARFNGSSYIAVRDSAGAKPIDETKVTGSINNPYESLTEEQLLVISAALEQHAKQIEGGNNGTDTNSTSDRVNN